MSFLPGGEPNIPNQIPIPQIPSAHGSSSHIPSALDQPTSLSNAGGIGASDPRTPQEQAREASRTFIRLAVVNGALLVVAVVLVYVVKIVDEERGIWLLAGAAALGSINTLFQVRRLNARRAAAAAAARGGQAAGRAEDPVRPGGPTDAGFTGSSSFTSTGSFTSSATGTGFPTDASTPFELEVGDVFHITGLGVVVTGQVRSGTLLLGQKVVVVRQGSVVRPTRVGSIQMFRKSVDRAVTGEFVGLALKDVAKGDVRPGDVIAVAPGTT